MTARERDPGDGYFIAAWITVIIAGFIAGFMIRTSGIHDPADQPPVPPTTSNTVTVTVPGTTSPPASPLFPGDKHPEARSSGRQAASSYPWFEGWEFGRKSVCIESGIINAVKPLVKAGEQFRVHGIAVSLRFKYGQCAAAGFGKDRTIVISYFVGADKTGSMKGACAYTQAQNYGTLKGVYIRVNVLDGAAGQRTACGAGPGGEWDDVFLHEIGHGFGLSHEQGDAPKSSIMQDDHVTTARDRARLGTIYSNNPR